MIDFTSFTPKSPSLWSFWTRCDKNAWNFSRNPHPMAPFRRWELQNLNNSLWILQICGTLLTIKMANFWQFAFEYFHAMAPFWQQESRFVDRIEYKSPCMAPFWRWKLRTFGYLLSKSKYYGAFLTLPSCTFDNLLSKSPCYGTILSINLSFLRIFTSENIQLMFPTSA